MHSKKPRASNPEQGGAATTELSQVDEEVSRLTTQVSELLDVLESIVLKDIDDIEDRLKAAEGKRKLIEGIPKLVAMLDDLRNRAKLKAQDVRGNKVLSPLEDGSLDEQEG